MPTFWDENELTTSGAFPARRAAMILLSLMPPTTLSSTSECALSYSATSFLNETSSVPALHPTQIVSLVADFEDFAAGLDAEPFAIPTTLAATASTVSRATTVATRFIGGLPRSGVTMTSFLEGQTLLPPSPRMATRC